MKLDAVIHYDLPATALIERMAGRRVCAHCGMLYHVDNRPPKKNHTCDACGDAVVQRADDQPAAIRERLRAYAEATAEVSHHYALQGLLLTIEASAGPEQIFARTIELLKNRGLNLPKLVPATNEGGEDY